MIGVDFDLFVLFFDDDGVRFGDFFGKFVDIVDCVFIYDDFVG